MKPFIILHGPILAITGASVVAERESMEYDVVIVGAGPSGLAAAIRLKQLCAERGAELSVCVLEKGSEVGAHILSGAVHRAARAQRAAPRLESAGRAARTRRRARTASCS